MDASVRPGSYAGLIVVAVVSATVALATVRLYRCLESEFRSKIQLQDSTYVRVLLLFFLFCEGNYVFPCISCVPGLLDIST